MSRVWAAPPLFLKAGPFCIQGKKILKKCKAALTQNVKRAILRIVKLTLHVPRSDRTEPCDKRRWSGDKPNRRAAQGAAHLPGRAGRRGGRYPADHYFSGERPLQRLFAAGPQNSEVFRADH